MIETGDEAHLVADLTAPGDWQGHAEDCDLVVHTAAVVGMYSSREGYWETNVAAARHVLDAAIAGGAKRFVHLSSIVVFGFDFEGEVDERSPVRPNGVHYVDTKIASEQVVLEAHAEGEIPCTIVRPGDVYGPRSRPWTTEAVRALKSKQLILPDGGRGLHSPVFVDDLVDGIVAGGDHARGRGPHLHPDRQPRSRRSASSSPTTAGCSAWANRGPHRPESSARWPGRWISPRRSAAAATRSTPAAIDYFTRRGSYSIQRARDVLAYEPAHDLDAGMAKTEEWLRAEGLL